MASPPQSSDSSAESIPAKRLPPRRAFTPFAEQPIIEDEAIVEPDINDDTHVETQGESVDGITFVEPVVTPAIQPDAPDFDESQTPPVPIPASSADEPIEEPASESVDDEAVTANVVLEPSWVFRVYHFGARSAEWLLGATTLVFGLAIVSAIPILQIATLGYLLEGSRRIAETGKFWSGAVGVRKAARIGSLVAGTWLCMLPIQYLSSVWYASNLIDPGSTATGILRVLQIGATVLIVPHILAAWYCGGRLRNFFWPFIAPFTIGLWATRKALDSKPLRPIMNSVLGWISPRLAEDICRAQPLTDWFLPAVLIKGVWKGQLFARARDGLWEFVAGLRLPYYFWLGLRGFAGTVAWMFIPSMLLIGISVLPEGLAALSGLLGVFLMSVVLVYVPFAQVHFAKEGRMVSLFDISGMRKAFRGSPILHTLSLLILLVFALPLFLLKIEEIPPELLWAPAVIFMIFGWPARMLVAWAYARGIRRQKPRIFVLTWPSRFLQWGLAMAFTLFLLGSQYIAWNGSSSLLENHVVLVPAPFMRWPF